MNNFKGKAIYNPSGKAGEYSYWACNFYNGCSNGCTYCYCKKGILAKTLGGNIPTLKKCFKNEAHALEVFEKELKANLSELQKHGLFFSFTTDPMLKETAELTLEAIKLCHNNAVLVKILTKNAHTETAITMWHNAGAINKHKIAIGFTLTGHDELEPNAGTNAERIEAMRKLHDAGFKTWASIEPIIDLESSWNIIQKTSRFCDLFKIGLMSGKKYDKESLRLFIHKLRYLNNKIYLKDSLLIQSGMIIEDLPTNYVNSDYNMFN